MLSCIFWPCSSHTQNMANALPACPLCLLPRATEHVTEILNQTNILARSYHMTVMTSKIAGVTLDLAEEVNYCA